MTGLFHRAVVQNDSALLCQLAAEDQALARAKAFKLGQALG